MTEIDDRHARGLRIMEEVQGAEAARALRDTFADVSPDFADWIVGSAFADVYGREGLTHPQRQLVTIGALTALGGTEPQLAIHIRNALNVGVSPREVVEAIFHTTLFAGLPRAFNALKVAERTFAEDGVALD
jgi:4-carboxymuconolactone decarboxylase